MITGLRISVNDLGQWETWYAAIRKALAHKAIAEHNSRTTPRLVHTHCTRRTAADRRNTSP